MKSEYPTSKLTPFQKRIGRLLGFSDLDFDVIESVRNAYAGRRFCAIWAEPKSVRWFYGSKIREILRNNVSLP